ncbi:hypothetical protein TNCV_4323231 [Trichonephila clavipes]|nr:hypothetical protein TNCV_4323231 [Trichonephila clavipes]
MDLIDLICSFFTGSPNNHLLHSLKTIKWLSWPNGETVVTIKKMPPADHKCSSRSPCDLRRQFPCRTTPSICIELSQVRDGRTDCPDGSDEGFNKLNNYNACKLNSVVQQRMRAMRAEPTVPNSVFVTLSAEMKCAHIPIRWSV